MKRANWPFSNFSSTNGPPPTPSVPSDLRRSAALIFPQMCLGRMYTSIVGSFGSSTELLSTTVVGSGAVAVMFAVVAEWLSHSSSREVLIVQAMSSEVSGLPSDHLSPSRSL